MDLEFHSTPSSLDGSSSSAEGLYFSFSCSSDDHPPSSTAAAVAAWDELPFSVASASSSDPAAVERPPPLARPWMATIANAAPPEARWLGASRSVVTTASRLLSSQAWGSRLVDDTTIKQMIANSDPVIHSSLRRLNTPGYQLSGPILTFFLQRLSRSTGAQCVTCFIRAPITLMTFDRACEILLRTRIDRTPLLIPVVIPSGSLTGGKHVVSVLVTNTHVEYYDAKGTPSEEAVFEDGHTLRDLLDVCAGIGHREGRDVDIREVVEFPLIQQTDRHSCGVHSSLFYYLRLVEGWSFSDFFEHRIDASTIRLFRQHIMREIAQQYPVGSP